MQQLKLVIINRVTFIIKCPAILVLLLIFNISTNAFTQDSFHNVPSTLIEELVKKLSESKVPENEEISAFQIRIPSRLKDPEIENWVAICKKVINERNISFGNPYDVADDYNVAIESEVVDEINHKLQDYENAMFMKRYVRIKDKFYRVDQTVFTGSSQISSSLLFDAFSFTLCNSVDNKNGELYSWEVHNKNRNAIIYSDNKHKFGIDPIWQGAFPSFSELLFHLRVSLFNSVNPGEIDRSKLALLADGDHDLLELKYREFSRNNKPMIEFQARVLMEGDKFFSGRSTKIICDANMFNIYEEQVFLDGENLPIRHIQRAGFDDRNIPNVYSVFEKQQNSKSSTDIFICLSWNKNVNFSAEIFDFNPSDDYVLTDMSGGGNRILKIPEVAGINPEFVPEGMRNILDKSSSEEPKDNLPRIVIIIILLVSGIVFFRVRNASENLCN